MAEDRQLLTDIRLVLRHSELRPVYEVDIDRRRVATSPGLLMDMGVVSGRDNLSQAIILRLLTPRGELSALGHPEYGSRLHELIGERNTDTKRSLIKLYILESLQMEPRIEKVVEITVEPAEGKRDRVNVLLRVKPVGKTGTVTIGPFILELEQ
ncbi:conserved domain protein [Candidatus Vecturithrix granuli]|uniref:Conserved domain protein n=1 Tax=Vecturithrix granuli TaxID=1499967 RepID=A0A081C215_VECG1|nr:conserved domain protein [Candidatus Vecturithrix granuli]